MSESVATAIRSVFLVVCAANVVLGAIGVTANQFFGKDIDGAGALLSSSAVLFYLLLRDGQRKGP